MRRCIACRESRPQGELMRFTFDGSELRADGAARADGRGIYLCRDPECLKTAVKRKSFNRVCRRNIDEKQIINVIENALNNG